MDTAALREVQRKLQDALARSEPDENLFAAAEVLERLDKSEAENKVLKAELARLAQQLEQRDLLIAGYKRENRELREQIEKLKGRRG